MEGNVFAFSEQGIFVGSPEQKPVKWNKVLDEEAHDVIKDQHGNLWFGLTKKGIVCQPVAQHSELDFGGLHDIKLYDLGNEESYLYYNDEELGVNGQQ